METTPFYGYAVPNDLILKTGSLPQGLMPVSKCHIELLLKKIGSLLKKNVFELGCGIGRDAIPLLEEHNLSSYTGADIDFESILWCQNHITKKHKNSNFYHFDIQNEWYRPNGRCVASDISIPLQNNSIDLIFLQSVFTHLSAAEVLFYLSEFNRILKIHEHVYFTCFIMRDGIQARLKNTNFFPTFQQTKDSNTFLEICQNKIAAVSFTLSFFQDALESTGFCIERGSIEFGSWSMDKPTIEPDPFQDIIVAKKIRNI
jgi:SAM-dependent methyltransferase